MAILKGVKNKSGKTIDVTKKIGQGALERSKEAIPIISPINLRVKLENTRKESKKLTAK